MTTLTDPRRVTLRDTRRHTHGGIPLEFVDALGDTKRLTYGAGAAAPYCAHRVGVRQPRRFSRLCDLRAYLASPA